MTNRRHPLTPEVQEAICAQVRNGVSPEVAAGTARVPSEVFEQWMRYARARRPARHYRDFLNALWQAECESQLRREHRLSLLAPDKRREVVAELTARAALAALADRVLAALVEFPGACAALAKVLALAAPRGARAADLQRSATDLQVARAEHSLENPLAPEEDPLGTPGPPGEDLSGTL